MLKRYTFWLWTAVVLLWLTGIIHSIGIFVPLAPSNETERQMLDLMLHYHLNLGNGFHPTMWDLFRALSSCYSFICFLAAMTIAYLLKNRAAPTLLKGIIRIHLLVFGAVLVVIAFLTFLAPILLTGLVVLSLAVGLLTMPGKHSVAEN